jgi:glycosyltransferase involved in cell wall biosynthesis
METNSIINENKVIAVIMSLYRNDTLDYVRFAIDSILNQTFPFFDFYIQVDGPIREDVMNYLDNLDDRRIIIRKRELNKGLASSLNELLEIIKQDSYGFIARMDADDIAILDRFQKQIDFLTNNTEIDIVGGAIREIDEKGNDRHKTVYYPLTPQECKRFFAKRNPVAHSTVIFRRSFFEKVDWAYPTDFVRNEDTRLWHEGYKHGCMIANIPDVVLNFRVTDSMFKQRRNGLSFAKSQLKLRKQIKKDLGYGFMSYVYAYAMFLLMVSPSWLIKIAYKVFR